MFSSTTISTSSSSWREEKIESRANGRHYYYDYNYDDHCRLDVTVRVGSRATQQPSYIYTLSNTIFSTHFLIPLIKMLCTAKWWESASKRKKKHKKKKYVEADPTPFDRKQMIYKKTDKCYVRVYLNIHTYCCCCCCCVYIARI